MPHLPKEKVNMPMRTDIYHDKKNKLIVYEEMIDGTMRCVVDETTDIINLYPVNNYCIVEDKKYSFY